MAIDRIVLLLALANGLAALFIVLRRQRNQAVAARAQLMTTVDALPALVSYVDVEQPLPVRQSSLRRVVRAAAAEIVGRPVAEVVGPDAYRTLAPLSRRALGGEAVRFRVEMPGRRGSTPGRGRVRGPRSRPRRRSAGAVGPGPRRHRGGARGPGRARRRGRARSRRFRMMADHAPVLIWLSGPDRSVTWVNRPWLAFTGRTMAEELGAGWADGIHPDERERSLEIYTSSFDARQPFTMEYRLRRHDGEYRWVLDNGIPLYEDATSPPARRGEAHGERSESPARAPTEARSAEAYGAQRRLPQADRAQREAMPGTSAPASTSPIDGAGNRNEHNCWPTPKPPIA